MFARSNNFLLVFRIANLLAASFFALCFSVPDSWCYGPFNPSPPPPNPHGPLTFREIILAAITFIWFVSSLGLFFRSRLGWFGSLVGVGMMNILFAEVVASIFGALLYSDAPAPHNGRHLIAWLVIKGLIEFMFIGFICLCLAFTAGLFLGLLKMRRDLSRYGRDA